MLCMFSFHQFFQMMTTKANTVMTSLKFLLLIVCSTFTAAYSSIQSVNKKCTQFYCLPSIVPIHYDIALMFHEQENNYFNGKTNITVTINHYTKNITLHSYYLHIYVKETKLISKNDIIYKPLKLSKDIHRDILTFYFDHLLYPGTYILSLKYFAHFSDALSRTVYRTVEDDRRLFFTMNLQNTGARHVFPCWDDPALKTTFNISVRHHTNYTAFSNMPIRLQQFDNTSNTSIWSYFETTPLMSTYLVGIAVIDVHGFSNKKSNFNIWYRQGLDSEVMFAKHIVDEVANQLTDYTNAAFKFPKLDIILIPNYMNYSNFLGLTLLKESQVIYNETKQSVNHKINVARRMAGVMAHQWFEVVVGPTSWSHDWLNKGLALFFQEYILNQIYKEWQLMDLMLNKLQSFHIHSNSLNKLGFVIHKVKAQILLRMLQFMISDEVFREGIITYLHKYQFDSATPHDLWDAMQHALNKMSRGICGNIEIEKVMDSWLKETSYPIVEVTRRNNNAFVITQKRFGKYEIEEKKEDIDMISWIPMTNRNCPNIFHTMNILSLESESKIVLNDPNDWILINFQQAAFHHIFDDKGWHAIADFMNSPDITKLSIVYRTQIINDAYYFLVKKNFNFVRFLNIVRYLSKETEYVPWLSMFTILSDISKYFSIQMKQVGIFKSYISTILNGFLHNIGYEDNATDSDMTKLMRATALSWACSLDDIECTRLAVTKMQQRIANFMQYASVMSHEKWIYCTALKTANFTTWREIMNLCCTMNVCMDTCLEVLTCSEKSEIIIEYLKILMAKIKELPITKKQGKRYVNMLATKHVGNNEVLDYILQQPNFWTLLATRTIPDMILNAYSDKQLRKIYNFSMMYNNNSEMIMRMIAMRTMYLNDITYIIFRNIWQNLAQVNKSNIALEQSI